METQRLRSKPKFSGPFFTWRKTLFTDRENGSLVCLRVYSSGSRAAVLKFLWLKFLWNELTKDEYLLFMSCLSDSSEDQRKWAFLNVLNSRISKKRLRKRLIQIETILGIKPSTRERYLGMKRIRIDIQQEHRKLPKVPKFSGYVRSISSIGRGSTISSSFRLEDAVDPTAFYIEEKIDWVNLLSVGSLTLFSNAGEVSLDLPEESQKGRNAERS